MVELFFELLCALVELMNPLELFEKTWARVFGCIGTLSFTLAVVSGLGACAAHRGDGGQLAKLCAVSFGVSALCGVACWIFERPTA